MKTDLYTKIVLTAIAIFLGIIIVKDIDFVSKAQANEVVNLSDLKIEKDENAADDDITFFIYENDKIKQPFSSIYFDECQIDKRDTPTHIVTTKKINDYERIRKVK